ncbi:MAG TPA: FAD:protein FMN transferase [Acidimicrobiales bacterium]|nr:FAD:protein FMN transferase [Acidimicrobiales bacterium]
MELVRPASGDRPALYRTAALGTRAEVMVTDPGALVAAVRILHRELDRIDRIASRFRADSEISRLHGAGGRPVRVSPELLQAIRLAMRMAEATDGALDPTVGAALCRLGYDRDFSAIAAGVPGRLPPARAVPGWRSIEVDPGRGTVRLPEGTLVDLGATAKALAADRVAEAAGTTLGCGVLVSLGGDVAVAGAPPPGGFPIGLGDVCTATGTAEAVTIRSGGLATSGIGARRWKLGSEVVHHIIDPASGLPATVTWRTVSVAAATCVEANAAATAAMVKGPDALAWLSSLRLPARLVGTDGAARYVAGWPEDGRPGAEMEVSA